MNYTVLLTIISGVLTYVLGQIFVKLIIEPVHEMKKTIGQISHSLVEHANVIGNPGVPTKEVMDETSRQLRRLSSELHAHLYLVPLYATTARIFFLPSAQNVRNASAALIGLSNSVFQSTPGIHEQSARKIESISDSLGIYVAESDRRSK